MMFSKEPKVLPNVCGAAGRPSKLTLLLVAAAASASLIAGQAAPGQAFPALESRSRPHVAPAAHPIAVFGSDERRSLPAQYRALGDKIGVLYDQRSRSVCTAFCVGEDMIATAAHCLYKTSGERPPRLTDFTFRLANQGAKTAVRIAGAATGAAGQNVASGSMSLSIRPPIDATRDWALVRLSAPACRSGALRLSRRTPKDLAQLSATQRPYQVGYHRDTANWQLIYGGPCEVRRSFPPADWTAVARDFSDAERLILHNCDTGGASSGSPLLIDGPSGPEVVGINVGTYVQSKVLLQRGEIVHRYRADNVANTGVSSIAFMDTLDAFAHAQILATRVEIRELQTRLMEAGFFSGKIDGRFGAGSRAAIEKFERAEGRTITGLATADTLRRLSVLIAERLSRQIAATPRLETGSVGSHRQTGSRPASR